MKSRCLLVKLLVLSALIGIPGVLEAQEFVKGYWTNDEKPVKNESQAD